MRFPQGMEWVILLLIVLLLFGASRLPDLARGVGKSLKIFKSEVKDLHPDDAATGRASDPATVDPTLPPVGAAPTTPPVASTPPPTSTPPTNTTPTDDHGGRPTS